MIKIAVDLDGADKPSKELVRGAIQAVKELDDLHVIIGAHDLNVEEALAGEEYDTSRVEFIPCGEPVTNYDDPMSVLRNKKDSSLLTLLKLCHQNDDIRGFVSCGATGSIMVSSIMTLGRVNGLRPALATLMPKSNGGFLVMCDCGANSDCKPAQLVSFAYMASAYYKGSYGVDSPRVALLSNGAEEKKGNELVKESHKLLKEAQGINFVGNVEGSNILNDSCDVLVTDGFCGNVVLKNVEGTAKTIIKTMVIQAKKCTDPVKKQVMMEMVSNLMNTYDFNSLGGAILLGVPKVLVKGHGAGNDQTFYSIIKQCYIAAKSSFLEDMNAVEVSE